MKIYDPWSKDPEDNPLFIQEITDPIFKYYMQYDACPSCKLNRSSMIPTCYSDCRLQLKIHPQNKCNPRTIIRVKNNDKYGLKLTRTELVWSYYSDYNFIFRANDLNDLVLHHLNRNALDDRFENIRLLLKPHHIRLHDHLDELRSDLEKLRFDRTLYKQKKQEVKDFMLNIKNSRDAIKMIENADELVLKYAVRKDQYVSI